MKGKGCTIPVHVVAGFILNVSEGFILNLSEGLALRKESSKLPDASSGTGDHCNARDLRFIN